MSREGAVAPTFELPGIVDGERTTVSLSTYLGDSVIVLAFYPGDFNPTATNGSPALGELELFTMQKDIEVFGISGDSVFSHQAFASEYALQLPLLSDVTGEVADAYCVSAAEQAGHTTRRAVVVIDYEGTIEYAWIAEEFGECPEISAVRTAIESVGSTEDALSRYREGFDAYQTAEETHSEAMERYDEREWIPASERFEEATTQFTTAHEAFETAVRFTDDDASESYFVAAKERTEYLSRATEWLGDAAAAFANGDGRTGEALEDDARRQRQQARTLVEPLEPAQFPPAEPLESHVSENHLSEEAIAPESETDDRATNEETDADQTDIDETELADITAEVEEQNTSDSDFDADRTREVGATDDWRRTQSDSSQSVEDARTVDGELEDDELEFDLVDPTEETDETDDDSDSPAK